MRYLFIFLIALALSYGAVAFFAWQWSPGHWIEIQRFLVLILLGMLFICALIYKGK